MSLPIPQAPDIETLFCIEDEIEPAIFAELKERGIYDVDAPRASEEAKTPRVEFEMHMGSVVSTNKIPVGNSERRAVLPTAWNCTLVFHVVTDRLRNSQNQGRYRGKIRLLCAEFWTSLNTRMPYYLFEKLSEASTQPNLLNDAARHEDITKMTFPGVVKIRDQAWPAGS